MEGLVGLGWGLGHVEVNCPKPYHQEENILISNTIIRQIYSRIYSESITAIIILKCIFRTKLDEQNPTSLFENIASYFYRTLLR